MSSIAAGERDALTDLRQREGDEARALPLPEDIGVVDVARELERKQRQAIDKYNQEVRWYNENVRHAVDSYKREARAHNDRVRANRQRLQSALVSLTRQPIVTRYVAFRASVQTLNSVYLSLERRAEAHLGSSYNHVLDLSEREMAATMGVSPGTVKSLLSRGLDALGQALEGKL